MKEVTLKEFLDLGHTQKEAAKLMGRTQGAVSQRLGDPNRDVIFVLDDEGNAVSCYEKKLLGARPAA